MGLTNILQLVQLATVGDISDRFIRVEGVLTWVAVDGDAFVLQDDSGAMRFELQCPDVSVASGQRAVLEGKVVLGKGKAVLEQILFVDNDGQHSIRERSANVTLQGKSYGLQLEYFQVSGPKKLEVFFKGRNLPKQRIPESALSHQEDGTNWLPGLRFDYYEGNWKQLPNFSRLTPAQSGIAPNFDLIERQWTNEFALRFTGRIQLPAAGDYRFYVASDDGSRLFSDERPWQIKPMGAATPLVPQVLVPGQPLSEEQLYRWSEVQSIIKFAGGVAGQSQLELVSDAARMRVDVSTVADGFPALLLNSHVRVQGVASGIRKTNGKLIATELLVPSLNNIVIEKLPMETWQRYPVSTLSNLQSAEVASGADIVHVAGFVRSVVPGKELILEDDTGHIRVIMAEAHMGLNGGRVEVLGRVGGTAANIFLKGAAVNSLESPVGVPPAVTPIEQIRMLSPEALRKAYRVKIRGVVTCDRSSRVVTVHDGTYGISCWFDNPIVPLNMGDLVEIEGVVRPGGFGPNISHARVVVLGKALLPVPHSATWEHLINGSLEQQWVEIEGVIEDIQEQSLVIGMRGGELNVELLHPTPSGFGSLRNAVVRIRGTVSPTYNAQRQVQGVTLLVSSELYISVEESAKADPFSARSKKLAELLRFDPNREDPFYRVKVHGQIVYIDNKEGHLMEGGYGLRFLQKNETRLVPGDWVDVVGFPELSGEVPVLREALARRTGHDELPKPQSLSFEEILTRKFESMRVQMEGVVLNWGSSKNEITLEIQSGRSSFSARIQNGTAELNPIQPGSRVKVTGTCVSAKPNREGGKALESFDLLLNSAADIIILELPPWWTVGRIMVLVGVLLAVLVVALTWIYQLRQKVEQRTAELKREMKQREIAELQKASAQERSRIARDLHDDLGSSLTEISLLASVDMPQAGLEVASDRFGLIAGKARSMVRGLDVIVWAVDPEEDEIQSFADYLSGFVREFLAPAEVTCRFKIPIEFPDLGIDGRTRHELLLAVKETLNNVVRHARAAEVELAISVTEQRLMITIKDNGCGFDAASVVQGNGLSNLRERLAGLGGDCSIESQLGVGTTVKLLLKLKDVT